MLSILCLRKSPADTPLINWRFYSIRPGFDHIKEIVSVYDLPVDQPPRSSISGMEVSLFREMDLDFIGQINFGLEHCQSEWVYIAADDEVPPASLLVDFESIVKLTDPFDAIAFPRMNHFPWTGGKLFWPDHQCRLVRNHVRFKGNLHERPDCHESRILNMPGLTEFTIQHIKSHEMQKASDDLYAGLAQ